MDDPYRTSQQVGTCPRCNNSTEGDGELGRLTCLRGCGEWYPKATLDQVLAWAEIEKQPFGMGVSVAPPSAWPWGAALCPICRNEMKTSQRGDVRFDYCSSHGLWLDAGEIQRFAQVFRLS